MNARRRISSFIGIALLFATAAFAQQVKTDYDRNTDFSQYKTSSWVRCTHKTRYGWIESKPPSIPRWLRIGDGFGDATTTEDLYKVGRLVVDLFDSSTKENDLAGIIERRLIGQVREEHTEPGQGRGEDV